MTDQGLDHDTLHRFADHADKTAQMLAGEVGAEIRLSSDNSVFGFWCGVSPQSVVRLERATDRDSVEAQMFLEQSVRAECYVEVAALLRLLENGDTDILTRDWDYTPDTDGFSRLVDAEVKRRVERAETTD